MCVQVQVCRSYVMNISTVYFLIGIIIIRYLDYDEYQLNWLLLVCSTTQLMKAHKHTYM